MAYLARRNPGWDWTAGWEVSETVSPPADARRSRVSPSRSEPAAVPATTPPATEPGYCPGLLPPPAGTEPPPAGPVLRAAGPPGDATAMTPGTGEMAMAAATSGVVTLLRRGGRTEGTLPGEEGSSSYAWRKGKSCTKGRDGAASKGPGGSRDKRKFIVLGKSPPPQQHRAIPAEVGHHEVLSTVGC